MMQELSIYLLKSSGLITAFYFAYYFLLRKETFFSTNRWFLLTGLATSVVLPLFFINKIVVIETPLTIPTLLPQLLPNGIETSSVVEKSFEIDWFHIGIYIYGIIAFFLFIKVVLNLYSLFKIIANKPINNQDNFQYIDVNEPLSPFSFFNYIVFNSRLYSESELQSILLHEKIHSAQKHSLDILVANLLSVIFWFNPFMFLYKKAVIQNLEYIADSEAIAQIDDKKSYQMALLKVVSHQNFLPITNHFNQSLIKKRIVMLNKNQSNKRNSWKYAVILPALIAFVLLFQVKVIAQEKDAINQEKSEAYAELVSFTIDKNSSNEDMKSDAEILKNQSGIEVNFSKIKRNAQGEIIAIKIDYKDKNGNNGSSFVNSNKPIDEIIIFKTENSVAIKSKSSKNVENEIDDEQMTSIYNSHYDSDSEENLNRLFIINGKQYTKEDLKDNNIAVLDANIVKLNSAEAVKRFGSIAKDGAIIFEGETKIINAILDAELPTPSNSTVSNANTTALIAPENIEEIEFDVISDYVEGNYDLPFDLPNEKIKVQISNIKRNNENKIIAINMVVKPESGKVKSLILDQVHPINTIKISLFKLTHKKYELEIEQTNQKIKY